MQPKIETLEQIAERLAPPHSEVCRSHTSGACDCWRTRQRIAILAALREVEARAKYEYGAEIANQSTIHVQMLESENAGFGILGALDLPSEKAEAEVERLRAIVKARNCAETAEAENERLRAALTACQVAANDIAEDNERLRDRLNGELK